MKAPLLIPLLMLPALEAWADEGDFRRIHPRFVRASSSLESQWARFDENYLPIYAADDNPRTAWIEGQPELGEGEWLEWTGPRLEKARRVRLVLKPGYFKTKALFRANPRPSKLRVQPLVHTSTGSVPQGPAQMLDVEDAMRPQAYEFDVPPRLTGFRIEIVAAHRGLRYLDTGISDIEVYVDGGDEYLPALEARVFEDIQAEILKRIQLAKSRPRRRAKYALATGYVERPAEDLAPVRGPLSDLGTYLPIAERTTAWPEAAMQRLKALTAFANQEEGAKGRMVAADGSPRLGAQMLAALPGLRVEETGLHELESFLYRPDLRLQGIDEAGWHDAALAWTNINEGLMYGEMYLETIEKAVAGARRFGFRGTVQNVSECEEVGGETLCDLEGKRVRRLLAVGAARLERSVRVLGSLRTPDALLVEANRIIGIGREGPGDVGRKELVAFDERGLPESLFLISRPSGEGGRGPDRVRLVHLSWTSLGKAKPALLSKVTVIDVLSDWYSYGGPTPNQSVEATLHRWDARVDG